MLWIDEKTRWKESYLSLKKWKIRRLKQKKKNSFRVNSIRKAVLQFEFWSKINRYKSIHEKLRIVTALEIIRVIALWRRTRIR
jgi:hypothetical protein